MHSGDNHPLILKLDVGGIPLDWVHWEYAATAYVNNKIAWEGGGKRIRINGGTNRATGLRSFLEMDTIIAVNDHRGGALMGLVPPLTNRALFQRDGHICLYCGERYRHSDLSRDHVVPTSKGGPDEWENCVTACGPCNRRKGSRSPEKANMKLLAVPYAPNRAEYLILSNRRILGDQQAFLEQFVTKRDRAA
ncbi:HNH endonuclease [bacterium]|nr:HNH endonuclease [bacterium]